MKSKTAEQIAKILKEIYEERFGGKNRGRFQLPRSTFRRLAGRINLRDSIIKEVADECLELGLVLIPIEDIIVVIEEKVMFNYRKTPKSITNPYMIEDEEEDEHTPEDEEE